MKLARLYRTVRHLRWRQVVARLSFKLRRIKTGEIDSPGRAAIAGAWARSCRKNVEILGQYDFNLLNKRVYIEKAGDWNDPGQDKLSLYHLHYHDALNTLDEHSSDFDGVALIRRWIADNPATMGNGWEPYPLSLRIVNWIKWQLEGNTLEESAVENLFLQARALSQQIEYHLLANHLFANAKALYFAGLYFGCAESSQWRQKAVELIAQELQEQILPDGGHFELSPMYQAIIIEDVLDIINIGRAYCDGAFGEISEIAQRMINWLSAMSHGDGLPCYFNDTTIGVAPSLRAVAEYGNRLGIDIERGNSHGFSRLKDSGYVRYQSSSVAVVVDVGRVGPDYQSGHAHCDCLSFELSIGSVRLLVNSGISTYNANERRLLERQTASHNTVSLQNQEQSEVWSAFRVGRRARPINVVVGEDFVSAGHDGYRTLGVTHRRRFTFKSNKLIVVDILDADTATTGLAHFHFHPGAVPLVDGRIVRSEGITMSFEGATSVEEEEYRFSEGFNRLAQAKKLAVCFESKLITTIVYEDSLRNR